VFLKFRSSIFALILGAFLCSSVFAIQYPQVQLNVTGGVSGSITVELYTDKAPITCENFIKYVQSGFYNDLIFHRVIKNTAIYGGGYYQFLTLKEPLYPPIINESNNGLANLRGTIAMDCDSNPDSATSLFFINDANNPTFDYGELAFRGDETFRRVGFCVFGHVVAGMSVVDSIADAATSTQNEMIEVPVTAIIIKGMSIAVRVPVCAAKLTGDIDGNCSVNFDDFALLAADWLQSNSITACLTAIVGDLNNDCEVNFEDFAMLAQNWFVVVSEPQCEDVLLGDITDDCRVDFEDLSELVLHWLESSV
jgi:cyclophilin family peptidyl-prolyl cis-trans isomerase